MGVRALPVTGRGIHGLHQLRGGAPGTPAGMADVRDGRWQHRLGVSDRLCRLPPGELRAGRPRWSTSSVPRQLRGLGGGSNALRRVRARLLVGLAVVHAPRPHARRNVHDRHPARCRQHSRHAAGPRDGIPAGGHSLGLALALAITGMAIPRGGYRLAFFLTCLGPVLGGILVWAVTRDTPNQVAQRTAAERLTSAVLRNRPAMLVITGYTCHSWELLGMWAWTPAFVAACFVAAGSGATLAAGLGSYVSSLFHITGVLASLIAGVVADRFGRTPVIFAMATLSTMCSIGFGWLIGGPVWVVVAVGLVYGFAALGDSPIYSTAITEVVAPAYRGAALALRSLAGYGAGAAAPLVFGWVLDLYGSGRGAEGGWGWAFGTLAIAGAMAAVSAVVLHRLPEARALHLHARHRTIVNLSKPGG